MADKISYSINEFIGDGNQRTYEVSFAGGYISKSHVKAALVALDGTLIPITFTWVNNSTVLLNAPVAAGQVFRIYRETPITEPLADYTDGAVVTEVNLDINSRQAVFLAQEAYDAGQTAAAAVLPRGATEGSILSYLAGKLTWLDRLLLKGDRGDPGGNVMSVGPFSTLATLTIPAGTTMVQTSGSSRGLCIEDTSLTDADVIADPKAIVKTLNGRFFKRDPRNLWLEQFDADPTGVLDSSPALRAAHNYILRCGRSEDGAAFTRNGPALRIGIGVFRLNTLVEWRVGSLISGASSSAEIGRYGTVFRVYGRGGMWFNRADTSQGVPISPAKTGADGFCLENVSFEWAGGTQADGFNASFGVISSCAGTFRNITGSAFPGVGGAVIGTSGALSEAGNANCFVVDNVTFVSNLVGFRVSGADANVVTFRGASTFGFNRSTGLLMDQFLACEIGQSHFKFNGNANTVHFGGMIYQGSFTASLSDLSNIQPGSANSANVWVPWKAGSAGDAGRGTWVQGQSYFPSAAFAHINNNARSSIPAQYIEGGTPPPQVMFPAKVDGGQVDQLSANSTACWDTFEQGEHRTNNAFVVIDTIRNVAARVLKGAFALYSGDNPGGLFFRPNGTGFAWDYAGVAGFEPAFITGQNSNSPIGVLRFNFTRGFGLGDRLWKSAAAPDTTSLNGVRVWNSSPTLGGVDHWTTDNGGIARPVGIIGGVVVEAQADVTAVTATSASNSAAAPTQAEFNALVAKFNQLVVDNASNRTAINSLLAKLRTANLLKTA